MRLDHRVAERKAASCYGDPGTGTHDVYITTNFDLSAKTIGDIYNSPPAAALFFTRIEQNLTAYALLWLFRYFRPTS